MPINPGGMVETDPEKLAAYCDLFKRGAKHLYEGDRIKAMKGDMWLFELYHHMTDCANALRKIKSVQPCASVSSLGKAAR